MPASCPPALRRRVAASSLPVLQGAVLFLALVLGGALPASADHETIVKEHQRFSPYGKWNGYKVFLSAPRHKDSRQRGECLGDGYEENINGRRFSKHGADGRYYYEQPNDTNKNRNLRGRGYRVTVSRNTRDNGFLQNRNTSENWGSDVHLVVHTNALNGCPSGTNYVLTMYRSDRNRSQMLATQVRQKLDPVVPNGSNQWSAGHAELFTKATHVAYLELAFHDNRNAQRWIRDYSPRSGWRIGWAIDARLGNPR